MMGNRNRIVDALSGLLQRHNVDAFVIFEEKGSGKYVQFAGSANEGLLLDLPSQTLTEEEAKRAEVLFSELGIPGPETYEVYTDKSRKTAAGMQTSFQVDFGRDVVRAAMVTLAIFERVYRFPPDFHLVLTEN
jgi:hypothetical protein